MQPAVNDEPTIISTGVFAFSTSSIPAESTSELYYHLIFRSNEDLDLLGEDARRKFYGFIFGCAGGLQGTIESIGGCGDSVHFLIALKRTQTPADFIRKMKLFTSAWAKRKLNLPGFVWYEEEVSTVSRLQRGRVTSYIQSRRFLF
ncbi:MAG: transposase [Pyrinomonadaceae bacterium]